MKRFLEFLLVFLLPALILGFIVTEHMGVWDSWLGLNEVERIATRFETSYAKDVDRWVDPGEPGWQPLLKLIRRYSAAPYRKTVNLVVLREVPQSSQENSTLAMDR